MLFVVGMHDCKQFLVYEFMHFLKNSTCLEGIRKLANNPWPHVQLKYTYNYAKKYILKKYQDTCPMLILI